MACRIVFLLLVSAVVSVSADAQDNYWTRKTRIQKTQPVQQKPQPVQQKAQQQERPVPSQPVRQMPVVPSQPVPVAGPVTLPSLTPVPLMAAAADSLFIQFRLDSIRIDMDFAANRQAWQSFERNFYQHYSHVPPRSIRLDIYSGASPEGTAAHNRWLGENRGIAIRRLVRQQLGNRVGGIIVHNEAARWDGLYDLLAASNEPWRDEALRIIEQTASADENQRDHREQQLRALRGGTAWPVLLERYLSPLRSGATAILSLVGSRDTIVVRDTIVMACAGRAGYPASGYSGSGSVVILQGGVGGGEPVVRKPALREPVWILRSNLPLLATGTPNLQAEWSLDHKNRWSVNAEGVWSWWTFAFNAYANEILYGSVELRRWLGQRHLHHTLDGWHVGLGLGGGYGDLEWKSRGYQGEVYSAFVNIGWQRRFGRRRQWAFDAGVGLGYAYVPWRRYTGSTLFPKGHEEYHDDHLMWRETGRNNWVGTPHFNISLGYVFRQKNGAWRRQKALATEAEHYDYLHFRDSLMLREDFERDSARVARRLTPEVVERAAAGDAKAGRLKMRLDAKMQRLEEDLQHEMQKVNMRYEQK